MDAPTRSLFEQHLGHDFGSVRIHADSKAAASARAVGASAYAVGTHVVFDGPPSGGSSGLRLLAHELAHVVQQGAGSAKAGDEIRVGAADDPAESAAEAFSDAVVAGRGASPRLGRSTSSNVLRRQPGPPTAPKAMRPWSAPLDISAVVEDTKNCFSGADATGALTSPAGNKLYSEACPAPICAKQSLPLRFFFHVDGDTLPRPQPFQDSRVALTVNFQAGSGGLQPVINATSAGVYPGKPGHPLKTTFGTTVPFIPPEAGTLFVSMTHADPTSGEVAVFSDAIPVVDCPQPGKKKGATGSATPTGIYVVIRDPKNAPLDYRRATKQDGLDRPGLFVEVERDDGGYFYRIEGQKYYTPAQP